MGSPTNGLQNKKRIAHDKGRREKTMRKFLEMLEGKMLEGDGGAGSGGAGIGGAPAAGTPAQGQQGQPAQQTEQPQKRPFKELIKGEYKEEFASEIKGILSERLKGSQQIKSNWEAVSPIVTALSQKYGIDGDMAGLAKAFAEDQQMSDALYAEAANREGIPVNTYKQMQQLKEDSRQLKQIRQQQEQQQQEAQRQQQAQQYFQGLEAQAAELAKRIPGFNLGAELQNAKFAKLVSPMVGYSVEEAYFAAHAQELQQAGMQYASQQAAQRVSQSVQAGAARPTESAAMGMGSGLIGLDPRNIDRKTREEINRRVRAGEKISF